MNGTWTRTMTMVALLVACGGRPPTPGPEVPPAPAPERELPPVPVDWSGELPVLADTLTPAEVTGCATDADCAITRHVDGSCCDVLCDGVSVYRASFVALLDAQRTEEACAQANCPVAKCMPPQVEHRARCVDATCVDDPAPLLPPPPG